MAICNLFNTLDKSSGNFMLFSQYVEDLTLNYSMGEQYKVVPSRFVALDINYKNIVENSKLPGTKESKVLPNKESKDLNKWLPLYFQNCFENACAYYRKKAFNSTDKNSIYSKDKTEVSRNLFWNYMFDGGILTTTKYGNIKIVNEVKYWGDITLQSYNEHNGMGYSEIYCYIPTDGERMKSQCIKITDTGVDRIFDDSNKNAIALEGYSAGYPDETIKEYEQIYYYNRDFTMTFDDDSLEYLINGTEPLYNINTIVVLYDVLKKNGDTWQKEHSYIPMGMYIAGKFDSAGNISNDFKKYVSSSYGTGTSYGLRICTRFTASTNGIDIKDNEISIDGEQYHAIGKLMSSMSESLNKMMEIANSQNNTTQLFKETMATIKNNRTNVPYVKEINGTRWWFVNGKAVTTVGEDVILDTSHSKVSLAVIKQRLENLKDNDPNNDFTYISDDEEHDCLVIGNKELANALGIKYDGPDYGGGTTGGSGSSEYIYYATDNDVSEVLWK